MDNSKKQSRFLVELPCAFGSTPQTPRNGTITSIGTNGCFVKTKAIVAGEQTLHVRVWTNEDRWLRLQGRVKYHMEKVGFSLTFSDMAEDDIHNLNELIEALRCQNQLAQPADCP